MSTLPKRLEKDVRGAATEVIFNDRPVRLGGLDLRGWPEVVRQLAPVTGSSHGSITVTTVEVQVMVLGHPDEVAQGTTHVRQHEWERPTERGMVVTTSADQLAVNLTPPVLIQTQLGQVQFGWQTAGAAEGTLGPRLDQNRPI